MQSYLFNTEVISAAYEKSLRDEVRAETAKQYEAQLTAVNTQMAALIAENSKLKAMLA